MTKLFTHLTLSAGLLCGLLGACGKDDMQDTPDMAGTPLEDGVLKKGTPYIENVASCMPLQTDYQPRVMPKPNNGWPACISDDNTFHLHGMGPPASASRTQAFNAMAAKLWGKATPPTQADFLSARDDYSVMEGLASRVGRRQDVHFPEIPGDNKLACNDPATYQQYPDRCFAPSRLQPLINDAFMNGINGTEPRVQAARIEAGLIWFLYLSPLSEVWTSSFDDIDDTDSVLGYYNGAQQRAQLSGLAALINAQGPATHNRIFDAILAERCWRDVDMALPATNTVLYNRALAQLDKSITRGVALLLRDRLGDIAGSTGQRQKAALTFVNIIGGYLDRAARAANPAMADALKAQVSATNAAQVNVATAQAAIDALFPCP